MEGESTVKVHTDIKETKWPGALKTATEVAKILGLCEERIKELADSLFIPHWRVSDGEPLFQTTEVKKWAAQNMLRQFEGKALPMELVVCIEPPKACDPPLSIRYLKDLRQIPRYEYPSGIYFLVKDDKVVYVGQSVFPLQRVETHKKDKEFDRVYMLPVPKSVLNEIEGAFIRLLEPILNGRNGGKVYGMGDPRNDSSLINFYGD